MMLYNHMAVFSAVAAAGSFTAGARKLGLPKSTVSHRISQLEDALGVRLLERNTRNMRLTSEGELFLSRCLEMEQAATSGQRLIQGLRAVPHGRLRITCPTSFANGLMARIIAEYSASFPNVSIDVLSTNDWTDLIEEDIDIAVRYGPLQDSNLIARPFFKVNVHLVASPSYLTEKGTPHSPVDIESHRCIKTIYSPMWRFRQGLSDVEIEPKEAITVNDLLLAKELALLGSGLAYLPTIYLSGEIESGELVRLLPTYEPPARQMYFVFASRQNLSVNATNFIDVAERCVMGDT